MIPADVPLNVYRGDSYEWAFHLWADRDRTLPVDLTGVEARAEIRDRPGGVLMVDLPLTITLPNTIVAVLSPDDGMKLTRRNGVWDLQLTLPDDTVTTVIAGHVSIRWDVTVPA